MTDQIDELMNKKYPNTPKMWLALIIIIIVAILFWLFFLFNVGQGIRSIM